MNLQKKMLGRTRLAKSRTVQGPSLGNNRRGAGAQSDYEQDDDKKTKQQKKAEYYKFYLDNAQKAIDLMIEQHKSQGSLS